MRRHLKETTPEISMTSEHKMLGENIRSVRHRLSISQEELAFKCGLHRTYVCDIERGARNLSFSSLLKLACGLGLNVSDLTRNIVSSEGSVPDAMFPSPRDSRPVNKVEKSALQA